MSAKENLLGEMQRALYKLQLQEARLGSYCPPYVQMDREDLERKIKELRALSITDDEYEEKKEAIFGKIKRIGDNLGLNVTIKTIDKETIIEVKWGPIRFYRKMVSKIIIIVISMISILFTSAFLVESTRREDGPAHKAVDTAQAVVNTTVAFSVAIVIPFPTRTSTIEMVHTSTSFILSTPSVTSTPALEATFDTSAVSDPVLVDPTGVIPGTDTVTPTSTDTPTTTLTFTSTPTNTPTDTPTDTPTTTLTFTSTPTDTPTTTLTFTSTPTDTPTTTLTFTPTPTDTLTETSTETPTTTFTFTPTPTDTPTTFTFTPTPTEMPTAMFTFTPIPTPTPTH